MQRAQTARIHRNIILHHHTKHIEHRRAGDGFGGVEIGRLLRRGAGEVNGGLALLPIDCDFHLDKGALIHLVRKCAVIQAFNQAGHTFSRIILHMAHIGLHGGQPKFIDDLAQLLHALFIGGDLRLQIIDILHNIAHWIVRAQQQFPQRGLAEFAAIHQLEIVNIDALLCDMGGFGRHGAGRQAADIGMVAA